MLLNLTKYLLYQLKVSLKVYQNSSDECAHLTTRLRGDIVTTSLCTSQQRCRYISNKTPNDLSVEHRKDISVVPLHNIILECRVDVSRGRNDNVPSVRLHNISNKSQMKHPTTSQWCVTKTSQWYLLTTSH